MSDAVAELGRWMLVAAFALLLLGVVALLPRALAVRRRARVLQVRVVQAQNEVGPRLDELAAQRAEMAALLRPWRLMLRWTTHPLTRALLRSYVRRLRR
jgi:hypothetical protein